MPTYILTSGGPVPGTLGQGATASSSSAFMPSYNPAATAASHVTGAGSVNVSFQVHLASAHVYTAAPDPVYRDKVLGMAALNVPIPDDVEIAADVRGLFYTSIPYWDKVIALLLKAWSVPDANVDLAGTFATAHTDYVTRGYRCDGTVQDPSTRKALLIKMGIEADSLFDWPVDKAEMHVFPEAPGAADHTLGVLDLVGDQKLRKITVTRSDPLEIVNVVRVRYRRNANVSGGVDNTVIPFASPGRRQGRPAGIQPNGRRGMVLDAYRSMIVLTDENSIRVYGPRQREWVFDFVRNRNQMYRLAKSLMTRNSEPREIIEITAKRMTLTIGKGDELALEPA